MLNFFFNKHFDQNLRNKWFNILQVLISTVKLIIILQVVTPTRRYMDLIKVVKVYHLSTYIASGQIEAFVIQLTTRKKKIRNCAQGQSYMVDSIIEPSNADVIIKSTKLLFIHLLGF